MVKVKICGITNLDDARVAIAAGADMLGFNFYRPSPRFIEPEAARAIIERLRHETEELDRTVTMVGVLVNEDSPEAVIQLAEKNQIGAIQLHGNESAEFCGRLKKLPNDLFVIKVLRFGDDGEIGQATEYDVDAIMVDAFDREIYGGTGRTVDWSAARRVRELVPRLFLAGGLSPDNIAEAIDRVQPYAVDACSALELSAGRKDAGRVRAFVRSVRNG